MKTVKIRKSYFDTFKWTSVESETTFFVLTQSQKSLLVKTAHTLAKNLKQLFFVLTQSQKSLLA
jgi:hypothetical protein